MSLKIGNIAVGDILYFDGQDEITKLKVITIDPQRNFIEVGFGFDGEERQILYVYQKQYWDCLYDNPECKETNHLSVVPPIVVQTTKKVTSDELIDFICSDIRDAATRIVAAGQRIREAADNRSRADVLSEIKVIENNLRYLRKKTKPV